MKHLKKLASLLLATIMVFGLTATAFATVESPTTPAYQNMEGTLPGGSITINQAVVGHTYSVYQLMYLESYDAQTTENKYKANTIWKEWLASQTDYVSVTEDGYVTWTGTENEATAREFAEAALAYAETSNINPVTSKTATGEANATVTLEFTNLNLGYYLIDSTVGSLCFLDTNNPDAEIKEKNTVPSNEKEVLEDSTVTNPAKPNEGTYGKVNDADIGDPVYFRSTITLPVGSANVVYHDTMSEGLTFTPGSVEVYACTLTQSGNENEPPVITEDNLLTGSYTVDEHPTCTHGEDPKACTFTVTFDPTYLADLGTEMTVRIKYSATINENAVIGNGGNENSSHLEYGDSGHIQHTPDSTTKTYVWSFNVFKYTNTTADNGTTTQTPLPGVEFVLLNSEKTKVAQFTTVENSTRRVFNGWVDLPADVNGAIPYANWTDTMKLTTDSEGHIDVNGLDKGTYYLREIKTLDGYNMVGDTEVKIEPNQSGTGEDTVLTWIVPTINVLNNSGSELPTTGGIGTTIFYVVGSILLVGAVVLLVVKKRMSVSK